MSQQTKQPAERKSLLNPVNVVGAYVFGNIILAASLLTLF